MTKLVKDYMKVLVKFQLDNENEDLILQLDQLWYSMTADEQDQASQAVDEYMAAKDAITDLQKVNAK